MADANTMIRCLIGDDELKINEFQNIRATQRIIYTIEVVAEVVYVLTKVYDVSREDTSSAILRFLKSRNIVCSNNELLSKHYSYSLRINLILWTMCYWPITSYEGLQFTVMIES